MSSFNHQKLALLFMPMIRVFSIKTKMSYLEDVLKLEDVLNKTLCWFDENKLSICFWEDKTKPIFSFKTERLPKFNLPYVNHDIMPS